MFRYYYRIYDKYGLDVIAIALFTDKYPDYKPDCYGKSLFGTEIMYAYNTFKLLDMKRQEKSLFCFFDGLLRLSEENEMRFKNELKKITEEVDGMSSLTFERSNLAEAIRYEARLIGHEEGKKEARYQFAREALIDGLEPERIAKITKLTIDEIRKLQEEINQG